MEFVFRYKGKMSGDTEENRFYSRTGDDGKYYCRGAYHAARFDDRAVDIESTHTKVGKATHEVLAWSHALCDQYPPWLGVPPSAAGNVLGIIFVTLFLTAFGGMIYYGVRAALSYHK